VKVVTENPPLVEVELVNPPPTEIVKVSGYLIITIPEPPAPPAASVPEPAQPEPPPPPPVFMVPAPPVELFAE
jgi:hypothetical protein